MLTIKTPKRYINEPGILKRAGEYIAEYGRKPLILGGKTALETTGSVFLDSLAEHGISYRGVSTFQGYPSQRQFDHYAELAKQTGADSIIGVGGGRVLDTAKAAGDILGLPVITVPTVAATCAAWAAVTIQYDDEGAFVQMRNNRKSADLVLADTRILLNSPIRYLHSGVVDTFAKYYENRPLLEKHPESITALLTVQGSKLAYDLLEDNTKKALEEAKRDIYGDAARNVVDAIIYLAGYAGSFSEDYGHYSFAHPFYHCSTRLANTRHRLHGEKVAYGILAQLFLENKPEDEILAAIRLFDRYDAAFTLEDLGIQETLAEDIRFLGKDIPDTFGYAGWSAEEIEHALLQADQWVKDYRNRQKESV